MISHSVPVTDLPASGCSVKTTVVATYSAVVSTSGELVNNGDSIKFVGHGSSDVGWHFMQFSEPLLQSTMISIFRFSLGNSL